MPCVPSNRASVQLRAVTRGVASSLDGSAVDHPLHGLWVAVAVHGDAGCGGVDRGEVVGGQVDLEGAEVLLEPLQAPVGFQNPAMASDLRFRPLSRTR